MIDVLIVMKKDLREWFQARESKRWTMMSIVISLGIFGVMMPLQMIEMWKATIVPALFFLFLPIFTANALTADSIAGERERKTLETLLATRLPDRAIFLGKVGAATVYAWGLTLAAEVISLIVVNVARLSEGLFVFSDMVVVLGVLGSLLVSVLVVCTGVFISLRAKSVRAAQQVWSMVFMAVFLGMGVGLPALVSRLPESSKVGLEQFITGADLGQIVAVFLFILVVVDVVLLSAAIGRFQRAKLILD